MNRTYYVLVCIWLVNIIASDQGMVGDISWQNVYINNNTDEDLTIEADVRVLSNINTLGDKKEHWRHETWNIPKRGTFATTQRLEALNFLHNIFMRAESSDTPLPAWMKQAYPIQITKRVAGKILIIDVGKTDSHWLVDQRYVSAIKLVDGGPSGYHLEVEQH